jgi:hypothetical protein
LLLAREPARLLQNALGMDYPSAWHLINFISFQFGVYFFFVFSRRWMKTWAAFASTLFFATQPLLWGHAFINPKDTILLAMMLLSVHLGLKMHASLFGPEAGSAFDALTSAWAASAKPARRWILAASLLWLMSLLVLFGGTPLLHVWLDSSVRAAASGEPSGSFMAAPSRWVLGRCSSTTKWMPFLRSTPKW